MTKTFITSWIFPNENKKKPEMDYTKSTLAPNSQSFKEKLLSGSGFLLYKWALKIFI